MGDRSRLVRLAAVMLLAAAGIAVSVWASMQVSRIPAQQPKSTPDQVSPWYDGLLPTLWSAAHSRRTAQSRFEIVFASDGDHVLQTHVLRLDASDPLVSAVREGRFPNGAAFLQTAGLPTADIIYGRSANHSFSARSSFKPPVLRMASSSPEADILLSGEFRVSAEEARSSERVMALQFSPWSPEKASPRLKGLTFAHPLQSQTLRLGVREGIITAIRSALPAEQTEASATITGAPSATQNLDLRVQAVEADAVPLPVDFEPTAEPEQEEEAPNRLGEWVTSALALVTVLCPWLVLLLAGRRARPDAPFAQAAIFRVAGTLCLTTVVLGAASLLPWQATSIAVGCMLLAVMPHGAAMWIRRVRDVPLWSHRDTLLGWVLCVALAALLVISAPSQEIVISWAACSIALAVAVPAGCLALRMVRGARALPAGPVLGMQVVIAACLCQISLLSVEPPLWTFLMLGLLLGPPVLLALLELLELAYRPLRTAAIVLASSAAYVDVVDIVKAWPEYSEWNGTPDLDVDYFANWIGFTAFGGLQVLLPIGLLIVFRGFRRLDDPFVRAAGIALAISAVMYPLTPTWAGLYSVAGTWAVFAWLLPVSRAGQAGRLATLERRVHSRLVRLELRRRIMETSLLDLLRGAQSRLASGDLSVDAFDSKRRELDIEGGCHRSGLTVRQAAFNSAAGYTAWENGLAALKAGLVLTAFFTGYGTWLHYWWFLDAYATTFDIADKLRWMLYPVVAAFVYGYFYPWLRGDGPVRKALCLLLALLPAEMIAMTNLVLSNDGLLLAAAIRVGQLLVICLALGLYWERRLLAAAALPWSGVRTWRSVRSLTAPVVTVLVAAATAAATALAGAAIAAVLQQTPSLPGQTPTSSDSPTGGR